MNLFELFADPDVTDLLVNSTNAIEVERNGTLHKTENKFDSESTLTTFAKELLQNAGARIDLTKPYAEASIQTDYGLLRVHCIIGGECSNGTQLSIRRHSSSSITLNQMLLAKFITQEQIELLRWIVQNKQNFVIAGATGSGKTTLLRAMLAEISHERIISIEDARELHLESAVSLFTRANNHEGVGEISLTQLLRESLRMRPDRIIIGEARGEELAVLLQALNTGHCGAGFTIHANNADEVLSRMLSMLAMANIQPGLGRMMITSAVQYVIFLTKQLSRKVLSIQKLPING